VKAEGGIYLIYGWVEEEALAATSVDRRRYAHVDCVQLGDPGYGDS
jgi:hypothetical protein